MLVPDFLHYILYPPPFLVITLNSCFLKLTYRLYKAWKANILFNHPDDAHKKRGVTESLELCSAKPPITDLDTLDMLYSTLKKLGEHAEAARDLWQKAAKQKPHGLDIQLKWFNLACEVGDWKTAQKVGIDLHYSPVFLISF